MMFEPVWGPIIAGYLFLAGLGAGAFIMAACLKKWHPDAVKSRRAAVLIAPIVVAVGLVMLMVDAEAGFHNPLRFALLLSNFGSVMTWGVVFLSVFMIVSIIVCVMEFMKKDVPAALYVIGVITSVCVAAYTGALLGVCAPYPLWNNALLPVLFLVSALSTGMACVLLVSSLGAREEFDQVTNLKRAHVWLPLIEIALIASLCFITASNSPAGAASVASLLSGSWAMAFWVGIILVGLCLPAVIELWLLFGAGEAKEASAGGHGLSALADAGVLVGGFVLRLAIVMAALPLPYVM